MKIKVHIKEQVYEVNCGSGIQDLAWLALSAAFLYGKEAYPKGQYIPTYLCNVDGAAHHPRWRINIALHDGDEVFVTLRDLTQPPNPKYIEWYDQAFGSQRNIMSCKFLFRPTKTDFTISNRQHSIVLVKFTYTIFKELEKEFSEEVQGNREVELYPVDLARKEFRGELNLPFGEVKIMKVCEVSPQRENENSEPRELGNDEKINVSIGLFPDPWSKKKHKEAMIQEEQEQRKKEEEALKKAQEQLQQEETQPNIPVKTLYDVWPDAPASLAAHFPLLYDVFTLYTYFHLPDEEMISAHDFFHILRTFDLITDSDEIVQTVIEFGDDLDNAMTDVLAPTISLQMFLLLLVRFSEFKHPEDTGYITVIETIAKSKAVWLQDYVKSELLKPEIFELFMENADFLVTKYMVKATPSQGIRIELKVQDFINLIMESEQLAEVITKDNLQQLCEDTLFFSSAKDSQMLFPDFLETLVRLAQTVPFNEEEIEQALANQPETVVLAEKLHSVIRILCGPGTRTPSISSRGNSRGKQQQNAAEKL
ncbi:unnamed protein product [Blepharisma stoltei]|uniref:Uncharacterized protein n=1 Tax=Blepharisma stoltei TaxID=1481888 RepID=A0AAU9K807_9CILI|nr:unnamed protein product [Blepharisma stoltei]